MKKIIAKVKDLSHHSADAHPDEQHHSTADADGLRASLYTDTSSQAPPRLGTTPIKGDLHEPASPMMAPSATTAPFQAHATPLAQSQQLAQSTPPQSERQPPVNFSRLPVTRLDRL